MNMQVSQQNARTKLALTYLAIIMTLSIAFSVVFYRESTKEAGFGLRAQVTQLRDNLYFAAPGKIEKIRDEGLDRFSSNLLWRLIGVNIGMLAVGTVVSFYLARKSLEPMEEALIRQSRFTSDAAHELRTPLTVMKTETEVALRSKTLSSADAKTLLRSNLEEVAKLETLTNALLRLAKSSDSQDASAWTKVKITDVIETAAERIRAQATARNINVVLPKRSSTTLRGDYDQLIELFVILLDNAVKYSKDNTDIHITAHLDDDTIVAQVKDHGIGINAVDLPHIFERFYRADQSRTKNTVSGYGLGLSVAEAIVSSHGGAISAESVPGEGTAFTVRLPRH